MYKNMIDFATYATIPENSSLWSRLLQQLIEGRSLSRDQAAELMQGWLDETIPSALSGAILAALEMNRLSSEELAGMAKVLLSHSWLSTDTSQTISAPLIDICATGADSSTTFNISVAVAFVAAVAGVSVAKHNNSFLSNYSDSADVLKALGINLQAPIEKRLAALREVGITFLFTSSFYPLFKVFGPLRQAIKFENVFNVLGVLVNPLGPTGQVIRVTTPDLLETITRVLSQLNTKKAIVLCGREQLDKAELANLTDLAILSDAQLWMETLNLQELGLHFASTTSLIGDNVQVKAEVLRSVLQGRGTQAQQDVVALNASLALQVGEVVSLGNHKQGLSIAREILRSGAAWSKVEELIRFLNPLLLL